jgi:hypothetical protein
VHPVPKRSSSKNRTSGDQKIAAHLRMTVSVVLDR